jgi:hypothetical protein
VRFDFDDFVRYTEQHPEGNFGRAPHHAAHHQYVSPSGR